METFFIAWLLISFLISICVVHKSGLGYRGAVSGMVLQIYWTLWFAFPIVYAFMLIRIYLFRHQLRWLKNRWFLIGIFLTSAGLLAQGKKLHLL